MSEIGVACQYLLAVVLLASGVPKLLRMDRFHQAVSEYRMLPSPLVPVFAYAATIIEILASVGLLTGIATRAAAFSAAGLLGLYSTAVLVNLIRGREMDCHCFEAVSASKLTAATLVRVLILGAGALLVALGAPVPGGGVNFAGVAVAGVLLVYVLLLIEAAQRALVLMQQVRSHLNTTEG